MSMSHVISMCLLILFSCGCARHEHKSEATKELYDKLCSYWEEVDAIDMPSDSLEQHIVDYLYLISHLDCADREQLWPGFYRNVEEHPNRTVVDYLGEWDSPLYSPPLLEEYLVNLLRYSTDDAITIRAGYLLENIRKNKPGDMIPDLRILKDGQETTLRRLIDRSGKDCLIIFYDPDCESCDAAFERLHDEDLSSLETIVISVTGKEKTFDKSWTAALITDSDEFEDKFSLKALPSVYIVSRDGTIRHKDIKF